MKRFIALTLLLLACSACGNKQKSEPAAAPQEETAAETVDMSKYMPNLEIGSMVPDFEAPDIAGAPVRLSDFCGKYVVLDFWATWCKDCRAEMPAMKELYNSYGPRGVQFLGVSFDTDLQSLFDYGAENEIAWLNVCNQIKWKENPISIACDIHWIPTMFLIDPEGKLAAITFTAEELGKALSAALAS